MKMIKISEAEYKKLRKIKNLLQLASTKNTEVALEILADALDIANKMDI